MCGVPGIWDARRESGRGIKINDVLSIRLLTSCWICTTPNRNHLRSFPAECGIRGKFPIGKPPTPIPPQHHPNANPNTETNTDTDANGEHVHRAKGRMISPSLVSISFLDSAAFRGRPDALTRMFPSRMGSDAYIVRRVCRVLSFSFCGVGGQ